MTTKITANTNITMCNNIVSKEVFRQYTKAVLETAADAVKCSFGPSGTHTTLEFGGHVDITKDGVSILKRVMFNGELERAVYRYLLESSDRVNKTVGDGTTSAFLATRAFYNRMLDIIDNDDQIKNIRYRDVYKVVMDITGNIIKKLDETSVKFENLKEEDKIPTLFNIAKISLNNSEEDASNFARAYEIVGINGDVAIAKSASSEFMIEAHDGYRFDYGYSNPMLINDSTTSSCKLDGADVIMFEGVPNNNDHEALIKELVVKYRQDGGKPLLLIASDLSTRSKKFLESYLNASNLQSKNNVCILYMSTTSEYALEKFIDYSVLFGANPVKVDTTTLPGFEEMTDDQIFAIPKAERVQKALATVIEKHMGRVDLVSYSDHTIFRNPKNEDNETVKARLNGIKHEIDRCTKDNTKDNAIRLTMLNKRLATLRNSLCTIYVGGDTDVAKEANMALYDDASKAIRACIENGYNVGCNLAIPVIITEWLKDPQLHKDGAQPVVTILNAMKEAFLDLYRILLESSLEPADIQPCIDKSIEHRCGLNTITVAFDPNIINPTNTDSQIVLTMAEVVMLLLTSNQYILETPGSNVYDEVRYINPTLDVKDEVKEATGDKPVEVQVR